MSGWTLGETKLVAGVPHIVVRCSGKCKQLMLIRATEEREDRRIGHYCMECAGLNRMKPGFGGVAYDHRSDTNYHGGYSE